MLVAGVLETDLQGARGWAGRGASICRWSEIPDESPRAISRFYGITYALPPELLTLSTTRRTSPPGKTCGAGSKRVKDLSFPDAVDSAEVLTRGVKETVFRPDITPNDCTCMCELGYFYLSNRFTMSGLPGHRSHGARGARQTGRKSIEDVL